MATKTGLLDLIGRGLADLDRWRGQWPTVEVDETTIVDPRLAEFTITDLPFVGRASADVLAPRPVTALRELTPVAPATDGAAVPSPF